jgi:hypothetical protein
VSLFDDSIVGDSMSDFPAIWTWAMVAQRLGVEPSGTRLRLEKHLAQHPTDGGLRPFLGLPVGQTADFRLLLLDCRGLHVQDFGTHYEAHIDQSDAQCDLVAHLRDDAPAPLVVSSALIGGLVGLLLGRSKAAFAAGLVLGAGVGGIAAAEKSKRKNEEWTGAQAP